MWDRGLTELWSSWQAVTYLAASASLQQSSLSPSRTGLSKSLQVAKVDKLWEYLYYFCKILVSKNMILVSVS